MDAMVWIALSTEINEDVQGGCNQTQALEYRSVVKVETAILGRQASELEQIWEDLGMGYAVVSRASRKVLNWSKSNGYREYRR